MPARLNYFDINKPGDQMYVDKLKSFKRSKDSVMSAKDSEVLQRLYDQSNAARPRGLIDK